MTRRAAFLIPPAHPSTLRKNIAKSCICHTCDTPRGVRTRFLSFWNALHRESLALPEERCHAFFLFQVLCLRIFRPGRIVQTNSRAPRTKIGSVILAPSQGNWHGE